MRHAAALVLAAAAAIVLAAPAPATAAAQHGVRVRLEADLGDLPPAGHEWRLLRRADRHSDSISVVVVLRKNADQLRRLEERFWAVSDPDHPDYGKHLTQQDVTDIVAPTPLALDTVVQWLAEEDLSPVVGAHRDTVQVTMPAPTAERLFQTKLFVYEHKQRRTANSIVRAPGHYSVPAHIAGLVQLVGNLRHFPRLRRTQFESAGENDAPANADDSNNNDNDESWPTDCGSCSSGLLGKRVTPEVLSQTYQLGPRPNGTLMGNISVAEFTQVYWDQYDLTSWAQYCGLANTTVDKVIGPANEPKQCMVSIIIRPNLCKEAILDITAIRAITGNGIPLTDIYTSEYSLLTWAQTVAAMEHPPLVHSVSYGNDEEQQSSTDYMLSVSVEMQKLGARGLTILFASGDGGVFGRDGSSNNYHPGFPAASPFVTAVGGTNFATRNVIGTETAWSGSGGGFSNTFDIPNYQADAVKAYKSAAAASLPAASKWNQTGMGFPDVAALGGQYNQYCIVLNKGATGAYGTSAATPAVAAVIARLNDIRLRAGKSPLGFVNPLFYKNPSAFHDVTTGSNGGRPGMKAGFEAIKGWDPVTGLGTPNFQALQQII